MDQLSIVSRRVGIDDKDNHYSLICWCTRPVRNAFLPSITLLNSAPISKPIRTGNPVQRVMAFD